MKLITNTLTKYKQKNTYYNFIQTPYNQFEFNQIKKTILFSLQSSAFKI